MVVSNSGTTLKDGGETFTWKKKSKRYERTETVEGVEITYSVSFEVSSSLFAYEKKEKTGGVETVTETGLVED